MRRRDADRATVAGQLRLGAGFADVERDDVVGRLAKLDRRLKRFQADGVELYVSVKDRDGNEQQVVLEARLPGFEKIVVTSRQPEMKDALREVREELWRSLDGALGRRTAASRRP